MMNRIILFLIFCSLFLGLIAQNEIDPNGYNQFFYENGQLSSEGNMRDGEPDGYWKNYYPNGVIKSEGNRLNYELDSIWRFYEEEGKIILEITYKSGKKNGFRTTYQGNEIIKENFDDDVD